MTKFGAKFKIRGKKKVNKEKGLEWTTVRTRMRKFQSENNNTCLVVMVTTSSSFCAAALTLAPESLKLKIKSFIQGVFDFQKKK